MIAPVRSLAIGLIALAAACGPAGEPAAAPQTPVIDAQTRARLQTAVFAGGCFWSVEHAFEQIPGVMSAVSGFAGGTVERPSYEQVVRGGTGHLEAVQVTFDPARISYRALADRFWRTIDPTDRNGQFCDQGPSYRTALFVTTGQAEAARASREAAQAELGQRPIVTAIRPSARFWPAGAEHQDYARRNPGHYNAYARGCRRAERLAAVWGRAG